MRSFTIKINGKTYNAEVEETTQGAVSSPVAKPAPKAAAPAPAPAPAPVAAGSGSVQAPMPGTVIKTVVESGATVKAGETVLILEAMKMENDIMAPSAGVVTVVAKPGQAVNTGDLLFTIA